MSKVSLDVGSEKSSPRRTSPRRNITLSQNETAIQNTSIPLASALKKSGSSPSVPSVESTELQSSNGVRHGSSLTTLSSNRVLTRKESPIRNTSSLPITSALKKSGSTPSVPSIPTSNEESMDLQASSKLRPSALTTQSGLTIMRNESAISRNQSAITANDSSNPHSSLIATRSSPSVPSGEEGKEAKKAKVRADTQERQKIKWFKSQKKQAYAFRQKAQQCLCLDGMAAHGNETRRDIFKTVLLKQRANSKGCMTLPVSIAFVALYCVSARLHEDITNVYLLETAFRHTFEPGLRNLETLDDIWDWIDSGAPQPLAPGTDLINTVFAQVDDYGDPLPQKDWSRFLHYSQFEGAVILRQYRDSSKPFGRALTQNLSSWALAANASREGFTSVSQMKQSRRLADLYRPEFEDSIPLATDDDHAFEFRLFPSMSIDEIRGRIAYLKDSQWLDEHTEVLEIQGLALNAELGRPRLEQMVLKVSLSRGGQLYWRITMNTLFLEVFPPGMMSKAMDGLWLFVLLLSIALELRNFFNAFWQEYFCSYVLKPTTPLEFFILGLGSLYFVFLAMMIVHAEGLKEKLEVVLVLDPGAPMSEQERASKELNDKATEMNDFMNQFRTLLSWYCIVLIFRFFIAFRVQPRLAVATNTLIAVTEDLVHFLFISLPCFMAYMVAGNLLFGRRLEEFSSLRMTCGTMFRILYENEYDWKEISEEHFVISSIWVWSYLIFVVFIMLNLVLAIILDTYNEVRMNTDSADTLFVFLELTMKRIWNSKRWVSNRTLEGVLTEMDGETNLTKEDLHTIVPGMTKSQADVIFQATRKEMHWKARADLKRPNMYKLSASVKWQLDESAEVTKTIASTQAGNVEQLTGLSADSHADALHMALRLRGHSRPFPGMPETPGGYNPPLLPPSSIRAFEPNGAAPPAWLQDLRKQTEQLSAWMVALQWQMSRLQWKFGRAHRLVDSVASEYSSMEGGDKSLAMSRYHTLQSAQSVHSNHSHWSGVSWNGPLRTKSGVWLL